MRYHPAIAVVLTWLGPVLMVKGCTHLPSPPEGPVFELEREWDIGSVDDPRYAFTDILGVARGQSGRLYIIQRSIPEVWIYDDAGTYVDRFGAYGNGPGEFQQPSYAGEHADVIWVADLFANRLSLFNGSGDFLRSSQFVIPPERVMEREVGVGLLSARARLADGDVVAWPQLSLGMLPKRVVRIPMIRVSEAGTVLDTIAWRRLRRYDFSYRLGPGTRLQRHRLGSSTVFDVDPWGGHVTLVDPDPDSSEVLRLVRVSTDGDTIFDVSQPIQPRPVTDELIGRLIDQEYQSNESLLDGMTREEFAAAYREALDRDLVAINPPATEVIVGIDGTTWVRREDDFESPWRWQVFSEWGHLEGVVLVPRNVRLFVVSSESAWGVFQGEFDVPHVAKYRVVPRRG